MMGTENYLERGRGRCTWESERERIRNLGWDSINEHEEEEEKPA